MITSKTISKRYKRAIYNMEVRQTIPNVWLKPQIKCMTCSYTYFSGENKPSNENTRRLVTLDSC